MLDASRVFGTMSTGKIPLVKILFAEERTTVASIKVGLDIFACSLLIQL